jgi:hypothetical protein
VREVGSDCRREAAVLGDETVHAELLPSWEGSLYAL